MIQIKPLKNCSHCIPALVELWHVVLGSIWLPDIPLEQVNLRFEKHLNDKSLPLMLVALHNDKSVGMCSFRENDGIRPDLEPWLGGLAVDPTCQKQGIGQYLIDATKQKAKEFGFATLHLFAFDPKIPDYYERLGWQKIGMDVFKDRPVTVMDIQL